MHYRIIIFLHSYNFSPT